MEAAMTKSMFIVERAQALRSRMHRDLQCPIRLKANGRVHDVARLFDKLYSFCFFVSASEGAPERASPQCDAREIRVLIFVFYPCLKWMPLSCVSVCVIQ